MRADYFYDGYTQPGYIAAVQRLHGALRFEFRPALVEERSQLAEAARRLKSDLYDRHAAQFLAQKLVGWDLADCQRAPVEVSAAALLRLHPELFIRLHQIVLGSSPSDIDPDWPAETADCAFDEQTQAALAGRTVGEVREEHDEKN